jgi:hypothetical protein
VARESGPAPVRRRSEDLEEEHTHKRDVKTSRKKGVEVSYYTECGNVETLSSSIQRQPRGPPQRPGQRGRQATRHAVGGQADPKNKGPMTGVKVDEVNEEICHQRPAKALGSITPRRLTREGSANAASFPGTELLGSGKAFFKHTEDIGIVDVTVTLGDAGKPRFLLDG